MKVGDVVQLRCGGPCMVVSDVCSDMGCGYVSTEWFNEVGEVRERDFKGSLLMLVAVKIPDDWPKPQERCAVCGIPATGRTGPYVNVPVCGSHGDAMADAARRAGWCAEAPE